MTSTSEPGTIVIAVGAVNIVARLDSNETLGEELDHVPHWRTDETIAALLGLSENREMEAVFHPMDSIKWLCVEGLGES